MKPKHPFLYQFSELRLFKSALKQHRCNSSISELTVGLNLEITVLNYRRILLSLVLTLLTILITLGNGFSQSNANSSFQFINSLPSLASREIQNEDTTICIGDSVKLKIKAVVNASSIENLDSGLVGYWPFNGNANDESGNGNNGIIIGATLTSDRFGNTNMAYRFDGDDFISAPRDPMSSFTASAWIYIEQSQNHTPIIDANVCNWELMLDNSLHPKFIEFYGNCTYNQLISSTSIDLNNWFQIASTYDNNFVRMYLNGKLISSFSDISLPSTSNSSFFFGSSPSGSTQYLKGKLDDIKIWNRALTPQELQTLYFTDTLSYLWSTGESTPLIMVSPIQSSTYYLTVADTKSSSIDSVRVSVFNTKPEVLAHDTIAYLDTNGVAFLNYQLINNGSSDYCGIDSIWISEPLLNCTHSGANIPIKLYVRNSVDNVDSATAYILVADTIAPKILNQEYTTYLDINGTATVANTAIFNGITENCAIANYNINPNSFTCTDVGVNNAIISATDQNGNVATASATIYVLDTIPPSVGTQNITIYLDENGNASISPSDVDNSSMDNCSISSMAVMPNTFTCADIGINTVMLKVTDASGNENSAIAMVTILDTIAPIALSHDISIYLDVNGTVSLTPVEVNNGSSDNCSVTDMNVYPSHFDQSKIGENLVVLETIDQCGNRDTTNSIVTVVDTIPPTPLVQNITVYLDANGNSVITPNQVDFGSFDNCGIDSIFLSQYEFSCDDIGENMIYFAVKDINENSSKAYTTVTIIDTIAPLVSTKSITLYLDENGKATTSASKVNHGSFDNCGIDSIYLSDSSFVFTDGDRLVIDLFILDASGNMNNAPAVVYLIDTIAPKITCPNNFETCDINISYKLPEVLDNTQIKTLSLTEGLPSGNEFEVGLTSNTYVVTDLSGNQNSCSFYIERYALPTVSLVPDTTVYYAENLSLAYTDSLAVSYQWTPSVCLSDANIKNPVCAPTENTKYTLEVTSENGCKAIDDVYVTVINEIKFAKAFSPNGDGQNDFFEIYGIELYPDCQVTILNRFGTIVFTSIGYANPWDGKFENEALPVASYFYIIALDDHQKPLTGSISIIR